MKYRSYETGTLSPTRIIHAPNQIKDVSELEVGRRYTRVHIEEDGQHSSLGDIEVLGLEKSGWIRVGRVGWAPEIYKDEISLSDCGIIPYKGDLWNIVNYLVPAKPAEE